MLQIKKKPCTYYANYFTLTCIIEGKKYNNSNKEDVHIYTKTNHEQLFSHPTIDFCLFQVIVGFFVMPVIVSNNIATEEVDRKLE